VLHTLGVDRASARIGVGDALARSGVGMTLSEVIARLLFWLLLLTFVLSSVETVGLAAVTATIDRLIAFIPRVIGAFLIIVLGLLFSRFVAGLAASAFSAAGFASGARVGVLVNAGVATLVGLVAVEQIGIDTQILVGPLTALIGAAAFCAGLCFALGARPIVTHILAGHFLRQSLPRDSVVQIGERRGVVERVGATDTLLRDGDVSWSVPNARILDEVVVR
jgi:small-conductance mechanosensitive channel